MTALTNQKSEWATPGAASWVLWLLGIALLATVVAAAVHFAEEREFLVLAERAKPWWLLLAFVFQAGTYVAQGQIWQHIASAGGSTLDLRIAFQLSLAKLFVDQALPSTGISGTILVVKALEQRAMPRSVVTAGVVVNMASFFMAYVVGLIGAFIVLSIMGQSGVVLTVASALFIVFSIAFTATMLALAGRDIHSQIERLSRYPMVQHLLEFLQAADPQLARSRRLLLGSTALQLGTVLLDTATLWVLIRSVGGNVAAGGVFASLMFASLVRTAGIVPGGLGTFEATSVLMLRIFETPLSVALSATLLFRGLSFWLPMIPGLWYSRKAVQPARL
jgi:Mg2+-importing ATPase